MAGSRLGRALRCSTARRRSKPLTGADRAQRYQRAVVPPSTGSMIPVTNRAASEARYMTA